MENEITNMSQSEEPSAEHQTELAETSPLQEPITNEEITPINEMVAEEMTPALEEAAPVIEDAVAESQTTEEAAPVVEDAVAESQTTEEAAPVIEVEVTEPQPTEEIAPVIEDAVAEPEKAEEIIPVMQFTATEAEKTEELSSSADTTVAEEAAKGENAEPAPAEPKKPSRRELTEAIYNEIRELHQRNEAIEVEVKSRIRGGLRVTYKDLPLFLPTSHFSLKRNPSEEEMQEAVGKTIPVYVHEFQEFEEGRKAVIVTRKPFFLSETWAKIAVGDIIEGRVSSVASFGIFVEFEGVEGLVHVSRLSNVHIDNPARFYKRGDIVKATIVDIDREKNRIGLSRKEHEESLWKDSENLFTVGSHHKGFVRRITNFGAYIELKPGIDGLVRTSELSWTKRIKDPYDVLKIGQEIMVEVMAISEEKQTAALSYKRTLPNPWNELSNTYPVGTEHNGTIIQVIPQGMVVNIDDNIDGFMPRSKIRSIERGKQLPYKPGEKIDVIIVDINADETSMILAQKNDETLASDDAPRREYNGERREYNGERRERDHSRGIDMPPPPPKINLGDILTDAQKSDLKNTIS